MVRRTKNSNAAGTTPMANSARQPRVGTIRRLTSAATTSPAGKPANIVPVAWPRMRPGMNSVTMVVVTGTSPPRPKLATKRVMASVPTLQETATSPVKSAKIATVHWKAVRRPM